MDPTYPLAPIANIIAFCLCLLPLCSKTYSQNIGICCYAVWVASQCITTGVNAIIWANNDRIIAPVWCDITTHLNAGATLGITACSFVMTRYLYKLIKFRDSGISKRKRRMNLVFELMLCIGIPIILMGVSRMAQETRFIIYEEAGCYLPLRKGALVYFVFSWNILLAAFSTVVYCPSIIYVLYRHRKDANRFLGRSSLSQRHFLRIFLLASLDATVILPMGLIVLIYTLLSKYTAVNTDLHTNRSPTSWYPLQVPAHGLGGWRSDFWILYSIQWNYWIYVFLSLVFFALLGTTKDARSSYKNVIQLFRYDLTVFLGCGSPAHKDGLDATRTDASDSDAPSHLSSIVAAETYTLSIYSQTNAPLPDDVSSLCSNAENSDSCHFPNKSGLKDGFAVPGS